MAPLSLPPTRNPVRLSTPAAAAPLPPPPLQDVPTAYAYELEAATIVQPNQVVDAVERVVGARVPVA